MNIVKSYKSQNCFAKSKFAIDKHTFLLYTKNTNGVFMIYNDRQFFNYKKQLITKGWYKFAKHKKLSPRALEWAYKNNFMMLDHRDKFNRGVIDILLICGHEDAAISIMQTHPKAFFYSDHIYLVPEFVMLTAYTAVLFKREKFCKYFFARWKNVNKTENFIKEYNLENTLAQKYFEKYGCLKDLLKEMNIEIPVQLTEKEKEQFSFMLPCEYDKKFKKKLFKRKKGLNKKRTKAILKNTQKLNNLRLQRKMYKKQLKSKNPKNPISKPVERYLPNEEYDILIRKRLTERINREKAEQEKLAAEQAEQEKLAEQQKDNQSQEK